MALIYNITDETCKAIKKQVHLQVLDLEEDFRITKKGLEDIFSILSLRDLNLRGVSVDNNLLSQFKLANPQCSIYLFYFFVPKYSLISYRSQVATWLVFL